MRKKTLTVAVPEDLHAFLVATAERLQRSVPEEERAEITPEHVLLGFAQVAMWGVERRVADAKTELRKRA